MDVGVAPPVVGPVDDVARAEFEGAALPFDWDTTPEAEVDLLAGVDMRAPLDAWVFLAEGPAVGGARIRPEDACEKAPRACRSLVYYPGGPAHGGVRPRDEIGDREGARDPMAGPGGWSGGRYGRSS